MAGNMKDSDKDFMRELKFKYIANNTWQKDAPDGMLEIVWYPIGEVIVGDPDNCLYFYPTFGEKAHLATDRTHDQIRKLIEFFAD
jgi:hypothetical protein